MNKIVFTILSFFFLFFSQKINSQTTQIYSSGSRTIISTFKTLLPSGAESFYFKLSPADQYSPEQIFRKFYQSDGFYVPHSFFISPSCQIHQFGTDCGQLLEVQSSRTDTGVILRAMTDPWWEPAGSIAITVNGGITRQDLLSSGFLFQYRGMSFDPLNDSIIYAMWYFIDSTKNFYKSTNRGNTWRGLTNINIFSTWPTPILRVNPFNNSILFFASYNSILKSTDGGLNFSQLSVAPGNTSEIVFDYRDSLVYFVTSTGLYRTDRNVDNWQTVSQIIFNTIKIDPHDSQIIYGGKENGLFRSTDKGITWNVYHNTFMPSLNVIGILKNPEMGDTLIVSTNKAVYKIRDQSIADTVSASYFPLKVGNRWIYKIYRYMEPNPKIHIMSVISDTMISNKYYYRLQGSFLSPIPEARFVRVDPLNGILYAYSEWCQNNEMIVDSLSAGYGNTAVGCYTSQIKTLSDTGSINQFGVLTKYKKFTEDFLFGLGKKYVKNFGLVHMSISEPPPMTDNFHLVGCVLDGVVFGDTLLTGIQFVGNSIPESFILHQNYPNPFNPVTKIKFDLPSNVKGQTSNVKLVVYDALGKEVTTLVNERLDAGSYEAEFYGSNFSSGIYFYKLESGNFSEVKRMVLLK